MTSKEEAMAIFSTKYEAWVESQKGQKDAYEYERSFDEFMQQVSREILQESVGREANTRKKNDTHQVRDN
jgi:hypothetical protein